MIRLAPSLLSADFSRLAESVALVERAGAHLLHVDVMDGHFVPNISFGPSVMKSLLGHTELPFDVHLMIETPDAYIAEFVTDNTEFITVHAEACVHLHRTLQLIRSFGVKAGVSLNPATPAWVLDPVFDELDQVLVMSVNPGFGGQRYIPAATDKIRWLAQEKQKRNPGLTIAVDGGITLDNARMVADAGADLLVAGSAVFGATDVEARVRAFLEVLR